MFYSGTTLSKAEQETWSFCSWNQGHHTEVGKKCLDNYNKSLPSFSRKISLQRSRQKLRRKEAKDPARRCVQVAMTFIPQGQAGPQTLTSFTLCLLSPFPAQLPLYHYDCLTNLPYLPCSSLPATIEDKQPEFSNSHVVLLTAISSVPGTASAVSLALNKYQLNWMKGALWMVTPCSRGSKTWPVPTYWSCHIKYDYCGWHTYIF